MSSDELIIGNPVVAEQVCTERNHAFIRFAGSIVLAQFHSCIAQNSDCGRITRIGSEHCFCMPGDLRELMQVHYAIFGLVIGLLARAVMPGRQHMGLVGAWLGGLIGRLTGMYEEGHPAGYLMALVGAVVVLFVYSLVGA